jgi:hypothetical protein
MQMSKYDGVLFYTLAVDYQERSAVFGFGVDVKTISVTPLRRQAFLSVTFFTKRWRDHATLRPLAEAVTWCAEAATSQRAAGIVIGNNSHPIQRDIQTAFFTHREIALPLITAKRVEVPWARLLDAPAIKMALRFDEGCIWDAPRVAAILGVSYAVTSGILNPSQGNYIGHPDGSYTDTRPGGRTYGPGGQVNF